MTSDSKSLLLVLILLVSSEFFAPLHPKAAELAVLEADYTFATATELAGLVTGLAAGLVIELAAGLAKFYFFLAPRDIFFSAQVDIVISLLTLI